MVRATAGRLPVDLDLPDAELWSRLERAARELPGFKPREVWAAEIEKKISKRPQPAGVQWRKQPLRDL